MEEVTKDRVVGVLLLILLLAYFYFLAGVTSNVKDTVEYKEGYSLGYSEHNYTKYQAADDINDAWVVYTYEQSCYAFGYLHGYDAYVCEEKERTVDNKRNEAARILGV